MPRSKKKSEPANLPAIPEGKSPCTLFYDSLGHDETMRLMQTVDDPRFQAMVLDWATPRGKRMKFNTLCMRHQISFDALQEARRRYQLNIGLLKMSEHVPQVLQDVAIDAKSRFEACPRCEGMGKVPDETVAAKQYEGEQDREPAAGELMAWKTCPQCKGEGQVRVPGDRYARELIFETLELTNRVKPSPLVQLQQNFNAPGGPPLERTLAAVKSLTE